MYDSPFSDFYIEKIVFHLRRKWNRSAPIYESVDVIFMRRQLIVSCGGDKLSYLNEACRDTGAGRDDGLETAVVHHEVTHCNMKKEKEGGEGKLLNAKKSIYGMRTTAL